MFYTVDGSGRPYRERSDALKAGVKQGKTVRCVDRHTKEIHIIWSPNESE